MNQAACYDCLLAFSGAHALEVARAQRPDLVLMDCSLPDMTGPEVCKILRADPQTAHIPVVLYTSDPGRETRLAALAAGADDVLRKPLDESYMLSRLRALLRKSTAERDFCTQCKTSLSLELAHAQTAVASHARIALVCNDLRACDTGPDLSPELYHRVVPLPEMLNPTRPKDLPDVLLLCPEVIELHGLPILSELRSREQTRDIPIVVLMPAHLRAQGGMALDLGAEEVLQAPFEEVESQLRLSAVVKRKLWADAMREALTAELDLATRDPLTGLFNRRHGLLQMAQLMHLEASTPEDSFALLLIDIDNFKRINDTYGHLAGDKVLVEVAQRMGRVIRADDTLARYGGEEFMLTLPRMTPDTAWMMAERIRKQIESTGIAVKGLPEPLRLTISIGISLHDPRSKGACDAEAHIETLIDEADRALHVAKASGRNRVVLGVDPGTAFAADPPRALAVGAL